MKFSVENAVYTKLWDNGIEGRQVLSMVLADSDLLWQKPHYWKQAFDVDPNPVPTNNLGVASFTVKAKSPVHTTVMDMRAPLGEGKPLEEGEELSYSGSIKDFIAPTWMQKATDRQYKEKMMEKYGTDAAILAGYTTDDLNPLIESGHLTLDYLAIKAETTGKCFYDVGRGIKGRLYKADIPEENFLKAGPKVWTDPSADFLTYIMQVQEKKWLKWGMEPRMQLKVTRDFFRNVIMNNNVVIKTLKTNWLTEQRQLVAGIDNVSDWVITEENFNKYVAAAIPDFPKLTIVKSKMIIDGQLVDPWVDGAAVLCPAGKSGKILRTDILDEDIYSKYANDACRFNFAPTENGIMLVMNSVVPNGDLKEWHTKVMMSAAPCITDFPWRVIIDTKTASA